jgi:demethylmenaquinone methyltransferase/2-methoxy-6-polyprenyl-1,4-benzoquinol methylase
MSEQVQQMFADIAPAYDRVNTVLSVGIHHRWRDATVRLAAPAVGDRVLDCATGTGDLALAFRRAVGPTGHVTGTDFCAPMIAPAPTKAARAGFDDVTFEVADVMALPYPDDRFDLATISFGIRNVDDPVQGLREMARCVKSGGRVVVLEFGQPTGLFGALYRFYSSRVMPFVGGLLSGNREAYAYLPRTSAAFPAGDRFLDLMDQTGAFQARAAHPLTFGVAWVYVGVVA